MVGWITHQRCGPIGLDLSGHSIKMVQLSTNQDRLVDLARWDLPAIPPDAPSSARYKQLTSALREMRIGRAFRGRETIVCLGARDLFVQNVRVAKCSPTELERLVQQEAAARLPYDVHEAEIRYLPAAEVRQGDATKREVILLACHRPRLLELLGAVEAGGLRPIAVDVEPTALLRSYIRQYRRDDDRDQRAMFVRIGAGHTTVVIARGGEPLFVKYIEIGGRHFDEAVAKCLQMEAGPASALRRHNGDRRADQQDPDVARSVAEAVRPVLERLTGELSLCIRYHSVTFRGQPIARMVLGGGEASGPLVETLATRLDVKCELGDPLRTYQTTLGGARRGQWDIASGLALREIG